MLLVFDEQDKKARTKQAINTIDEQKAKNAVKQMCEKLLVNLKNKYTVILVTHNLRQAMRVADETCFMIKGEIIEYRNTKDFFESPQDQRTKEYISHE